MASQIPMIIPKGYYDNLGLTTIRTPIAIERMLGNPNPVKVTNPLFPMSTPPNRSANEADSGTILVADASNSITSDGRKSSGNKVDAKDIYSGILKPGGGLYAPGPPVMLPPQSAQQQLAAALMSEMSGADKSASWRTAQGRIADPSWAEGIPDIPDIPHASGTLTANKSAARLDSPPLMAYGGAPGMGEAGTSLPEKAIAEILINGPMHPPTGGANRGRHRMGGSAPLAWEDAQPSGPAPSGDPWGNMRYGQNGGGQPGLVMGGRSGGLNQIGNPAAYSSNTKPALSAYQTALSLSLIHI